MQPSSDLQWADTVNFIYIYILSKKRSVSISAHSVSSTQFKLQVHEVHSAADIQPSAHPALGALQPKAMERPFMNLAVWQEALIIRKCNGD